MSGMANILIQCNWIATTTILEITFIPNVDAILMKLTRSSISTKNVMKFYAKQWHNKSQSFRSLDFHHPLRNPNKKVASIAFLSKQQKRRNLKKVFQWKYTHFILVIFIPFTQKCFSFWVSGWQLCTIFLVLKPKTRAFHQFITDNVSCLVSHS